MSSMSEIQRALWATKGATIALDKERILCLQKIYKLREIINAPELSDIRTYLYQKLNEASAALKENKRKRVEMAKINRYLKSALRTRVKNKMPASQQSERLNHKEIR